MTDQRRRRIEKRLRTPLPGTEEIAHAAFDLLLSQGGGRKPPFKTNVTREDIEALARRYQTGAVS